MIHFRCPRCKERIIVPEDRAGEREACPACKLAVEVPRPAAVAADTRPASPPTTPPDPAALARLALLRAAATGRTGAERTLELIGLLSAALGGMAVLGGLFSLVDHNPGNAYASLAAGIPSFFAGLGLSGLATGLRELRRIRLLLQAGIHP